MISCALGPRRLNLNFITEFKSNPKKQTVRSVFCFNVQWQHNPIAEHWRFFAAP